MLNIIGLQNYLYLIIRCELIIMGKKNKKPKKISAKKEKYTKFRKEKPGALDITMPDLGTDGMKEAHEAEDRLGKFARFNKNAPVKEVRERKAASKR
ncbi:hypothetical protein HN814_04975 [Candidatus Woesearchaeota archaeon]|nr:hypothetical protein [Candidatus Woesearchaeota archaeon]